MSHIYTFSLVSQALILFLCFTPTSLLPLHLWTSKNVEPYQLFLRYSGLKDVGLTCRRGYVQLLRWSNISLFADWALVCQVHGINALLSHRLDIQISSSASPLSSSSPRTPTNTVPHLDSHNLFFLLPLQLTSIYSIPSVNIVELLLLSHLPLKCLPMEKWLPHSEHSESLRLWA